MRAKQRFAGITKYTVLFLRFSATKFQYHVNKYTVFVELIIKV